MRNLKTGQKFEPKCPNVKSGTYIVQLPVFFIHWGKLHGAGTWDSGCAPAFPLAAIGLSGGDAEKELLAHNTLTSTVNAGQSSSCPQPSRAAGDSGNIYRAWMTFLATLRRCLPGSSVLVSPAQCAATALLWVALRAWSDAVCSGQSGPAKCTQLGQLLLLG